MKKSGFMFLIAFVFIFVFIQGVSGCPECSGSLSPGSCAGANIPNCGGKCNGCNQKIYCDDYPGGYRTCTSFDSNCAYLCISTINTNCAGSWGVCNSSGLQTYTITTPAAGTGTPCPSPLIRPCTYLNIPYFSNLSEPNSVASSADLGDTILMRMPGTNLDSSVLVYNVYVKNGTVWWNPLNWFGIAKSWSSMASYSGTAYQEIEINNNANYKFDVSIQGQTSSTRFSQELSVKPTNNSMPVAVITSPSNINFALGVPIQFTQASYDEDDLLEITWNFGDGQIYRVYNYSLALTPGLGNTNHVYNNSGVYTVILTVKEMKRGQQSSQSVQLFAFKPGINVFPIITSPEPLKSYSNFVNFNASQSFVAECNSSLTNYTFTPGNLQCKYLHAPGTRITLGYNVSVAWTVYSGVSRALTLSKIGDWNNNYTNMVEFTNYFENANTHEAVLTLNYN
ncbi:PKD domain-containing protein [Candidatus Pacearchaeota archaeon]|nr:PKD domain-containing protein [Candidatus Pacearchaeota archaeon]